MRVKSNLISPSKIQLFRLILLAGSLVVLGIQISSLVNSGILADDDFVEYWAAGRLNHNGGNPYDPQQLFNLQTEIWPDWQEPLMMWNPPWTLALVMPFGLLPYHSARLMWLLGSFMLVMVCADWIWQEYGGSPKTRWLGSLIGFTFLPTLLVLRYGQISVFLLAGLTGFLYSIRTKKYLLAGMACSLLAIKPHLLVVFWLALGLWVIKKRQYKLVLGCAGILALGSAIAWTSNPNVFGEYFQSAGSQPPTVWVTPTFGTILRFYFGPEKIWLQFIPLILGAIWLGWYWFQHQRDWSWIEQMPVIVLASMITTPFGWSWDLVVIILIIVPSTIMFLNLTQVKSKTIILTAYCTIQLIALTVNLLSLNDFWNWWMASAITILYIYISRRYTVESNVPFPESEGIPVQYQ